MLVHHSGVKSKEFFYAYMKLILLSRTSSFEEMYTIVLDQFFNGNIEEYGTYTKEQFELALNQIRKEINK
ncbi:putative protein OS=Ureibacillus acetophenoni OX=614649 GN=SAMN05877842_106158 PE=4 SV=1 [Ureibacillus acetophenoni]